jgi:hypothetical protein
LGAEIILTGIVLDIMDCETASFYGLYFYSIDARQKLWLEDGGVGASGVTNSATSALSSGTYTPTADIANSTNVSAAVLSEAQWIRIGNVVMMSCYGTIDPIANTQTNLLIPLPIASSFTDISDAAGTGKIIPTTSGTAGVHANVANDELEINIIVTGTTSNQPFTFQCMYKIK